MSRADIQPGERVEFPVNYPPHAGKFYYSLEQLNKNFPADKPVPIDLVKSAYSLAVVEANGTSIEAESPTDFPQLSPESLDLIAQCADGIDNDQVSDWGSGDSNASLNIGVEMFAKLDQQAQADVMTWVLEVWGNNAWGFENIGALFGGVLKNAESSQSIMDVTVNYIYNRSDEYEYITTIDDPYHWPSKSAHG